MAHYFIPRRLLNVCGERFQEQVTRRILSTGIRLGSIYGFFFPILLFLSYWLIGGQEVTWSLGSLFPDVFLWFFFWVSLGLAFGLPVGLVLGLVAGFVLSRLVGLVLGFTLPALLRVAKDRERFIQLLSLVTCTITVLALVAVGMVDQIRIEISGLHLSVLLFGLPGLIAVVAILHVVQEEAVLFWDSVVSASEG